ncbi:hypothetical protein HK099_003715 [Clydaea vesicula]|uniref:Uncharacterized protein n=1 Tax=Clydaea vesicula TaxID=447962 RepID=A0AAD5U4J6_9FUNG|nr:hypothetical protein HK099_003715 [Clydaea vesicula]
MFEMLIMEWIEISQRVSNLVEGKVKTQDFLHGLKNDTKKLARAKQLLLLEKEISKVKKIYNINDEAEI